MSLWINAPDIEARLRREAVIRGMSPSDYAVRILADHLPDSRERPLDNELATPLNHNAAEQAAPPTAAERAHLPFNGRDGFYDSTLALFDAWAIEDATDDPQELAQIQQEEDELLANLARNRGIR